MRPHLAALLKSVPPLAVVSGVAGAALDPSIVLILGAANLFADGFSLGMSNYPRRRSELDYQRSVEPGRGGASEPAADATSPERTAFVTVLASVLAGEMFLVGMTTALVAYVVGDLLEGLA